jgi:hypothetical protein
MALKCRKRTKGPSRIKQGVDCMKINKVMEETINDSNHSY